MIWDIVKKEFLLNITTFKYVVGTCMCTVLVMILLPVLISDYQKRLEPYHYNVAHNEAELHQVKCYWSLKPIVHRLPSLMALFSRGLERKMPDSVQIELSHVPVLQSDAKRENPYLAVFPSLDISKIMEVMISLLALLMAYDVISGEREQETLKLILANGIPRSQVYLGKYLAGMMTLAISMLITFCVIMIVLLLNPKIAIAASDWLRIGLMFLAYLLFISSMYNVGMFFSCLIRKSSVSLMFSVLCWVILLFVVPVFSQYLASFLVPVGSREEIDANVRALEAERDEGQKSLSGVLKTGNLWGGPDSFGGFCYDLCEPGPTKYLNECFIHNEPRLLKYANDIWEIKSNYNKTLSKQRKLAESIAKLSPACLLETLTNTWANTDYGSCARYINAVKDYRGRVVDYIKMRTDNFHRISYFTPGQSDEERVEYYSTMEGRKKHFDMIAPLVLGDFPRFDYHVRPVTEGIKLALSDLTVLILINLLLLVVSLSLFLRCDIR